MLLLVHNTMMKKWRLVHVGWWIDDDQISDLSWPATCHSSLAFLQRERVQERESLIDCLLGLTGPSRTTPAPTVCPSPLDHLILSNNFFHIPINHHANPTASVEAIFTSTASGPAPSADEATTKLFWNPHRVRNCPLVCWKRFKLLELIYF